MFNKPEPISDFEWTDEAKQFWQTVMKGSNHLLTGEAGTGKTYLERQLYALLPGNTALLAPTGIAALNAGGMTIHSFFKFGPTIDQEQIRRRQRNPMPILGLLDTLIIDEISMVRADLFDCIDSMLRIHGKQPGQPFGGVQIILVGDPYQIEPVLTKEEQHLLKGYKGKFFFNSNSFQHPDSFGNTFQRFNLSEPFRQRDDLNFAETLNRVRKGHIEDSDLEVLNKNVADFAITPEYLMESKNTMLTSTNQVANQFNMAALDLIEDYEKKFYANYDGWFAEKNDKGYLIHQTSFPAEETVTLKVGARVMAIKNNRPEYVNGSMGTVVEFGHNGVWVSFDSGNVTLVERTDWEHPCYMSEADKLGLTSDGTFNQIPLKLAWANTIHKSQGLTLERGIVNFSESRPFSHGQTYVALSRMQTQEGLTLTRPLQQEDFIVSSEVARFMTSLPWE